MVLNVIGKFILTRFLFRRTFGHQTSLPLSAEEAAQAKWVQISSCDENLGILFAQEKNGPSEKHPLALRYTASGHLAGVQATVFGSTRFGPSALPSLVKRGYWKKTANETETWHMDVSFRDPSVMCSGTPPEDLVGDRVVINQDTIKQSIPLTAAQAVSENWSQGSCMAVFAPLTAEILIFTPYLVYGMAPLL